MRYLITGSTSGIGLHITKKLLENDNFVDGIGSGRLNHKSYLEKKININFKNFSFTPVDFLDLKKLDSILSDLNKKFSGIILCAGITNDYKHFSNISNEEALNILKINFIANTIFIKKAKKLLSPSGSIVVISSNTLSLKGSPFNAVYAASKSALEAYSLAAQKDLINSGIRLNVIRPGLINSGMNKKVPGYTLSQFNDRINKVPIGRAGSMEEIFGLVEYFLSDKSTFTFGQIISVAGGE